MRNSIMNDIQYLVDTDYCADCGEVLESAELAGGLCDLCMEKEYDMEIEDIYYGTDEDLDW